jgi:uncharacterized membrane protein
MVIYSLLQILTFLEAVSLMTREKPQVIPCFGYDVLELYVVLFTYDCSARRTVRRVQLNLRFVLMTRVLLEEK